MIEKSNKRCFNFPIQLLQGFILNDEDCLKNICEYAIYDHSSELDYGDKDLSRFKSAASYYAVTLSSINESYRNGKILFDSVEQNSPKAGLNVSIFWDFMNNKKNRI
ncbi:MAG: hypothetical protein MUP24_10385 [Gillisia sp.]|nr:hypothetical protein [Gillisia sp.]